MIGARKGSYFETRNELIKDCGNIYYITFSSESFELINADWNLLLLFISIGQSLSIAAAILIILKEIRIKPSPSSNLLVRETLCEQDF